MTKCIFITGTGTDVGKTYVSALILKKLKAMGFNCGYYKPVLSGAVKINDSLTPEDAKNVIEFASLNETPQNCISYMFEPATSPHLAAKLANTTINKAKIFDDFQTMKNKYDYLLIEGAGGITCPLYIETEVYLLSDLIKDMNTNIIIVANAELGTINSTLLTVEHALNKGIGIEGIILNNYDETNIIHIDNKNTIEKLTNIKVISVIKTNENEFNIDLSLLRNIFKGN